MAAKILQPANDSVGEIINVCWLARWLIWVVKMNLYCSNWYFLKMFQNAFNTNQLSKKMEGMEIKKGFKMF
jgi:hypothetical protein